MTLNSFQTPGVYLKGLETETLQPFLSAITGFVGIAQRGPLNVPQPIRNWAEFPEVFGGFVPYSHLAESVYGFFLNGGEKCYVVRIADTTDRTSENIPDTCKRVDLLRKASNTEVELITDENARETIRIEAINEGSWGNEIQVEVHSESSKNIDLTKLTEPTQTSGKIIKVDCVYDFSKGGKIRITHKDNPLIKRSYTIDSINETNGAIILKEQIQELFPKDSVVSGPGFRLFCVYNNRRETFDNLSMNPENLNYFVDIINGDPSISSYIERARKGYSILIHVEHIRDGATGRSRFKPKTRPAQPGEGHYKIDRGGEGCVYAHNTLKDGSGNDSIIVSARVKGRKGNNLFVSASAFTTKTALRIPAQKGGNRNTVTVENIQGFRANDILSIISSDNPSITEDATIINVREEHILDLDRNLTHEYPLGSGLKVRDRFTILVKRDEGLETIEKFYNLSMDSTDNTHYFKKIINQGLNSGSPGKKISASEYICVDEAVSIANPPKEGEEIQLNGGRYPGEIDYRYYTGYEDGGSYFVPPENTEKQLLGLAAFEVIDEISLVAIPDLNWITLQDDFISAQNHLLYHCQKMGERFALLDPMWGAKPGDIVSWPLNFSNLQRSKFGALYYPWLLGIVEGEKRQIPPSGFIAGIIAQTDRKDGINKAPANVKIKGIVDVETHIDQTMQDEMNSLRINCIRKFENGAIKVWGARTLSPELKGLYINVRRVLLYVIKTLSKSLLWTVFEPNTSDLWKRIESTLYSFFLTMISKGMTASPIPEEAFYVKCNEETNTRETIESGQVNAEVGVALTAPAEFIVITVRKTPESLNIVEEEI